MKHTSGPWRIADKDLSELVMSQWPVFRENEDGTKIIICSAWKTDDKIASIRRDVAEANVHLIAASPELFKIANVAEIALNHIIGYCPPHTWPKEIDGVKGTLGDIRMLLEIIEGGNPDESFYD